MTSLWDRLPLPEEHMTGLDVGLAVDRLAQTRLPSWTRPIGLALCVAGVAVNAAAVRARGQEALDRPSGLVDQGPYGWTRNPMYLGWSMIHLGAALALRSPGMAVTWPVAAALVHREILVEERQLTAQFGTGFATYAASVPRYLDRSIGQTIMRSARARARTPRPRSGTTRRACRRCCSDGGRRSCG
jgi:protein-S-isoprenylcysteine O-methyltransferase Ste14